jgi:hypothetical protein
MDRPLRSASYRTLPTLFAGAMLALVGCKSTDASATDTGSAAPQRVEISDEISAVAEVTAVEREARMVTLKREDGSLFKLQVGQAARNFEQIAVGDKVRVRYKASLAASLRPAGETAQAAQGVAGAARTEAGAKPGGGVGLAATVRVKVESVDLARDIVTMSLASGELVSHRLATPEGRAFAKGLKVGDIVQIDYSEALALSVEEL